MIQSLNKSTVEKPARKVKILQFGEGNFLRAFADWAIDIANEKGVMDAGVAICKPRPRSAATRQVIDTLRDQDNMFHVCLEGMEHKTHKRDQRLVRCVMDSFSPHEEYDKYEHNIISPELRVIISNTTEAGISYVEEDIFACPPSSFPAKMAALLYRRFKHFEGAAERGVVVICCELIEDNATTLKEYVLRHARRAALEQEFIDWLNGSCAFCDSLVDRIVTGFPEKNINEVKQQLGYDDNAVVMGELYHLWVIGGEGYLRAKAELPLDEAGLNVVFTPNIKQFRDKKVRILNGSHTGMVAMALLMGCETVVEAFNNPDIERFVLKMVNQEVIPVIGEDAASLKTFADGILERFYNPAIQHRLRSISLNSLSKWEARNYPTLKDNWERFGRVAECEAMTFAALLALYGPDSGFEPDDEPRHIAFIRDNWDAQNLESTVSRILCDGGIFHSDFSRIAGFVPTVAMYLRDIEQRGMAVALKSFLG